MNTAIKVTKSSDLCQVQGEHELPTTYTTNGEVHNIAEDFRGAKKQKAIIFLIIIILLLAMEFLTLEHSSIKLTCESKIIILVAMWYSSNLKSLA